MALRPWDSWTLSVKRTIKLTFLVKIEASHHHHYYHYYYYYCCCCCYYYYYFYSYTRKSFTESLLNWKTSTGPNSAQLPFLYVITQTLETVNVELEWDYLHLLKKISITKLSLYNLYDGYKFDIMYKGSA